MNKPYIYANTMHTGTTAIVVLPEIFGVTNFIKRTVDRFAEEFSLHAFALDHFYSVTGKAEVFDYHGDIARGVEIMQQMTGEGFYKLFTQALDDIQSKLPKITEFVVVGFCFGGRLAYLAGVDKRVTKVVSFYGGQPHLPNYFQDKTPIEALVSGRGDDKSLKVLSFYGGLDESIPEADRVKTKDALKAAHISFVEKVYPEAGHAYFNDSRPERYEADAANVSWQEVISFING